MKLGPTLTWLDKGEQKSINENSEWLQLEHHLSAEIWWSFIRNHIELCADQYNVNTFQHQSLAQHLSFRTSTTQPLIADWSKPLK